MPQIQHRINGVSTGQPVRERRNPANTSDVVAVSAVASRQDVEDAVAAARATAPAWSATPSPARGRILMDAADLLTRRRGDVARDLVREEGKTLAEATGEVQRAIDLLRYHGSAGWRADGEHFPTATQIVDLYHAREHAHALGVLVAPALGANGADWLDERLADLDRGDVAALLAAGRQLDVPQAKHHEVDKALSYFQNNAERMRYADFRSLGHFVGSGAVEAGCKAVIGQRLKLSGMRWSVRGAAGIATLRCQEASGRWQEIWKRPRNQTSAA